MATISSLLLGLTGPTAEPPVQSAEGQVIATGMTQGLTPVDASFQTVLISQLGGVNPMQPDLTGQLTIRLVPSDPVLPSLADLGKVAVSQSLPANPLPSTSSANGSQNMPTLTLAAGANGQSTQKNAVARFSIPGALAKAASPQAASDGKSLPVDQEAMVAPVAITAAAVVPLPDAAPFKTTVPALAQDEKLPATTTADGKKAAEVKESLDLSSISIQGASVSASLPQIPGIVSELPQMAQPQVPAMTPASPKQPAAETILTMNTAPKAFPSELKNPVKTVTLEGTTPAQPKTPAAIQMNTAANVLAAATRKVADKVPGEKGNIQGEIKGSEQTHVVPPAKDGTPTIEIPTGSSVLSAEKVSKEAQRVAPGKATPVETLRSQTGTPVISKSGTEGTVASALKKQLPELDDLNISSIETTLSSKTVVSAKISTKVEIAPPPESMPLRDVAPMNVPVKEIKAVSAAASTVTAQRVQSEMQPPAVAKQAPANGSVAPQTHSLRTVQATESVLDHPAERTGKSTVPLPNVVKDIAANEAPPMDVRPAKSEKVNAPDRMTGATKSAPVERPGAASRAADTGTGQGEGKQASKEHTAPMKEEARTASLREPAAQVSQENKSAPSVSRPPTLESGSASTAPVQSSETAPAAAHFVKAPVPAPTQEMRTERAVSATLHTFPDVIVQEVTTAVSGSSKEHATEIRLTLKPESLGEIIVKVSMEDGKVKAEIEVANSSVRNILESSMPFLRDTLIARGVDIQKIDILTESESGSKNAAGQQEPRQKQRNDQEVFTSAEQYAAERNMGYNTIELTI